MTSYALVYLLAVLALVPIYLVITRFRSGRQVNYNEVEAVLICSVTLALVMVTFMAE